MHGGGSEDLGLLWGLVLCLNLVLLLELHLDLGL